MNTIFVILNTATSVDHWMALHNLLMRAPLLDEEELKAVNKIYKGIEFEIAPPVFDDPFDNDLPL